MIVVCTDGTTFQCEAYEVIDAGVMLFGEERTKQHEEDERYATDEEQIGYVPHTALLYIVPDGVAPQSIAGLAPQIHQSTQAPQQAQSIQASPPQQGPPTQAQSAEQYQSGQSQPSTQTRSTDRP